MEIAVEVLLVRLGSDVVAVTVAVFEACVDELKVAAVTLIVITAKAPTPIEPILHVTVPALCEQLPSVVDAETYVTSVGRRSDTLTPSAVAGPLLVTWSVYVRFVPWSTGSGEAVL